MNRNNSSQTLAGLRSFLFEWSLAAILLHLDFGWFSFIHTTFGQVEKKKQRIGGLSSLTTAAWPTRF